MEVLLSIVVLAALSVCFTGIYALLYDPKCIDEEERFKVERRHFRKRMTTTLT